MRMLLLKQVQVANRSYRVLKYALHLLESSHKGTWQRLASEKTPYLQSKTGLLTNKRNHQPRPDLANILGH